MESQLSEYRRQQAERFQQNPSFLEMQRQQEERDLQYAKELAESLEREQKAQQEQSQRFLEKDEEMARRLQEEEESSVQAISNMQLHSSTDESEEDERIANQLQEEEEVTILEEETPTTSEQSSLNSVQSSVTEDEEIARRLQHEELLEAQNERQRIHRGMNLGIPQFPPPPIDPSFFLDNDEDMTEELTYLPRMPSTIHQFQTPEDIFDSSQDRLLGRMREFIALRNRRLNPIHNMVLPGVIFHNISPSPEEIPSDYESLLRLGELIQPVNRGATKEQLNTIPIRTFTKGSIPEESAQCGICLQEYEEGEKLNTLPRCLHHFHKTCCDKWLSINKVCPVCREDIEGSNK